MGGWEDDMAVNETETWLALGGPAPNRFQP